MEVGKKDRVRWAAIVKGQVIVVEVNDEPVEESKFKGIGRFCLAEKGRRVMLHLVMFRNDMECRKMLGINCLWRMKKEGKAREKREKK